MYRWDLRCAPWIGTAYGVVQTFSTFGQHETKTRGNTIRAERNMSDTLTGKIGERDREVMAVLAGVIA